MKVPQADLAERGSPLRTRFIKHLEEGKLVLPLLPDTAASVINLCGDDDCDAEKLAALIQRDVSLAGHVLRISNSAAYAPSEPIVSLTQAVSRLGFSAMCGIAIGVAVQGKMFKVNGHEEELKRLWRHCAAAGAWAKEVARLRRRNVEGAFLCGLLHDIGKPIILQSVIDLTRAQALKATPEELTALMDEFHAQVGAKMLTSWDMPDWMVAAVEHHHDYEAAGDFKDEAATACLGDLLGHWSIDSDEEDAEVLRNLPAFGVLGLYADELGELFERSEQVAEIAESFQ